MRAFIYKERTFIAACLLLHLLWFVISIFLGNMNTGDSAEYEQQAINIREHGSFYAWYWDQPIDNDYHTWRPPVYGIFIFLCKFISSSNYFYIFLQTLFSVGTCILILFQCLQLNPGANPRWWILLGTSLYPSLFMIANSISADTLFLFIVMAALTCLQQYLKNERNAVFIAYNLLLILAVLTKPVLLYFWILNILFFLYLYTKKKKAILLLLPLLFPLAITLWCARNYKVTGYWHFSSVSHINLVYYNANYALMHKFSNQYADSVSATILKEAKTKTTYAEQVSHIRERSVEIIRQYPLDYLYWHIKGSVLLFLEPGRSDWIHYFDAPPPDDGSFSLAYDEGGIQGLWSYAKKFSLSLLMVMGVLSIWNFGLLILTVLGLWQNRKHLYIQFLLLFFMYMTAVTGVVGCARYRLTIYPIMLLGAFLFVQTKIFRKRSEDR